MGRRAVQNPAFPYALHYRILWRCFICHEDLYDRNTWGPVDAWQRAVVSLFPYQNDDGSVRVLLKAVEDLEEDNMLCSREPFIAGREDPAWRIAFCSDKGHDGLYCRGCRPDQVVFLAHKCCWKAVNHPPVTPSLRLLKLAQHTRPLGPPLSQDVYQRCLSRLGRQTQLGAFSIETTLGSLLKQVVHRLPLELQCDILDYLEGSLFASLLKAKTVAPVLLNRLGPDKYLKPRNIDLGVAGTITTLHVESSNILGRSFLTRIGFNQPKDGSWIPVQSPSIQGLQYALGEFGLRAVRIIYADGSRSTWLGDPSACWLGNVIGSDLQMLYVLADDIRLIRLGFKEADYSAVYVESSADNSCHLLLDRDLSPIGRHHSFVTAWTAMPKIPYYPNHRPCYYLPLVNGREYVSGITVYMGAERAPGLGIKGIASHGPLPHLIGHRTKCSIHMALSPGEYLNSLWMHISCGHERIIRGDVVLSVTTNRGRSHHFGPYYATQRPSPGYEHFPQWTQVTRSGSTKITGIFFDALAYEIQQEFYDIGVIEEDEPGHRASLDAPSLTTVRYGFPNIRIVQDELRHRVMQSTATLDDISHLQVRRVGPRCMGLRISHGDGTIEILGQWDPADLTSISTLYDVSEGPLYGLTFQTTPTRRYFSYMIEITPIVQNSRLSPRTTASPFTQDFACEKNGQRLAWWFTHDLDSVTLCSAGLIKRIKRQSPKFPPSLLRY